ncbi:MAG: cobalamin biosynthesis protein [Paracoccaceae bacterium]
MRVAGFGFRAGATTASLRSALGKCGGGNSAGLTALATPEDKADAAAVRVLAGELGVPIRAIPLALLGLQPTQTLSSAQPPRYGAGSVAEASALAACGPGAQLRMARVVSDDGMATAAIAEGNQQ